MIELDDCARIASCSILPREVEGLALDDLFLLIYELAIGQ